MNGAGFDDPSTPPGAAGGHGPGVETSLFDAPLGHDQFRLLAENIPTLCWMAKADGYIFWYNRRWHEYCGTTPEEMEGWGWQSVHDPDILPSVLNTWTSCIETGHAFEMTFPLKGADGAYHPFLTRVEPARDSNGQVTGWFGVNTDVSDRIDAEQQLLTANVRLENAAAEREAILSQLGEGVIVTDSDGRITFVNQAATRLHGVARLDVAPDEYTDTYGLLTEDGVPFPTHELPLARAIVNGETVTDARWRIRRPDGSEVLAMGNARPVSGEDGKLIGAVLTIRDDTARHAAEEALADALAAKDILLHEVNHRVKNSLQLVTSLLMLQAGQARVPELKQALLEARARIGVVAEVHHRLYSTSQHDRVDLAEYVEGLGRETVAALDASGQIQFRFAADGEVLLPLDRAVPVALIVSELLTNCVKYAFGKSRAGTIKLEVRSVGDDIWLAVTDDGIGLPEGFSISGSQGLGMRIVTALVRQLRADLAIESADRGSRFVLQFKRV